MNRLEDLRRLYEILSRLEQRLGGKLLLRNCHGRFDWPAHGVYFFFEDGEVRIGSGVGPRVVRVGTHALKAGSRSTLWNRLSQHRGKSRTEGGNHRGSIFRLLVGAAIKARNGGNQPVSWGVGGDPSKAVARLGVSRIAVVQGESHLETAVSRHIERMPFLYVAVEDVPGPKSARGVIERNAIGLLSDFGRPEIDPPNKTWLGFDCDRPRVRASGLWNNNHVDETHDPAFLEMFSRYVDNTRPLGPA